MAGFAVLIGAKMGGPISIQVFIGMGAAFFICGAGNAINDYFDYDIDKVNNPSRPIPSGLLALESVYKYSIILFVVGVVLSLFINLPALILATFNSFLLYLYAERVKRGGGLTKNLTVSYLVASPFLFGGLVVKNSSVTLFLVFVAILVNTSREIVKDIEDFEGDSTYLESLPVKYGFRVSGLIASTLIISSILVSFFPYQAGMVNRIYLLFIIPADAILIYCVAAITRSPEKRTGLVKRLIKVAMVLALLGFFFGSC
jgi:geranylgeranylglycerol-phosphate geranylgeranyltransferase